MTIESNGNAIASGVRRLRRAGDRHQPVTPAVPQRGRVRVNGTSMFLSVRDICSLIQLSLHIIDWRLPSLLEPLCFDCPVWRSHWSFSPAQ
jgi:hypothetical protein